MESFPDANIPYDVFKFKHHRAIVIKRFEEKHCICNGKPTGRPTDLAEDVANHIQSRMQFIPRKSLLQLSAQTGCQVFLHYLASQ